MTHQRIGYIRVSTSEQKTDRQLDGVSLDKTFTDTISGSKFQRVGLDALLAHVRAGDTVLVHSLDRLGRSVKELTELLERFHSMGVVVQFVKESLTYNPADPFSTLMIQQLSAFAQFERSIMLQRQAEGIAKAKQRGAYKGRKPTFTPAMKREAQVMLDSGASLADTAVNLGTSRATLYRHGLKAA